MPTLNFSLIADDPSRAGTIAGLLGDFEQKSNHKIQLQRLSWNDAWEQVLDFALRGKAPDISHIGSTWSSSLSSMRTLRSFTKNEIDRFGGAEAFFTPCWMSTFTSSEGRIWSIPWSSFTYVLVYRRDLIRATGLDETTAFDTAEDMQNTLQALQTAGVKIPWAIETVSSWDLIHIAASWVWGAGGDYMNRDGSQILLLEPETLAGLGAFFHLFRYLAPQTHFLNNQQCLDLFRQGRSAMTMIAVDTVPTLLDRDLNAPEVCENLGTAALPGKPWVGGDNLVIWKNALVSSANERATLDLVHYLTSKETQIALHQAAGILPTRADALAELSFEPALLGATLERVFERGQAHPTFRLWGRVETGLRQAFGDIVTDILSNPQAEIDVIVKKHLQPLARRLKLLTT